MQKIAEKTAEIRSVWNPTEANNTWDRLDLGQLVEGYRREYSDVDVTARMTGDEAILLRSAELFRKALDEAVENAIEHNDHSSPEVTITIEYEPDEARPPVSVADNGPGIPDDELRVLVAGEETPLIYSLGVGLWLMRWVTTTLGGDLTIEDNDPRGSIVTFQLSVGA